MTNHFTASPTTRAELRRTRATAAARPSDGFRPDIQGLRAIAVTLVLVYHLWPDALPGGYIGVDVFFVVSGFLISQHLFREVAATGRVAVRAFWARRIRRLLPASLLVLAATLAATFAWMPASERVRAFTDIGASALYVVNWVFGGQSIDYLAQDDAPSVVQHYWSLAVEEQLYVIWPLVIVAIVLLVARLRRAGWDAVRTPLAITLGIVFAASLMLSVVLTATSPGEAYFSTFVRAWEFAAGGLLALVVGSIPSLRIAPFVAWLGVALILVAGFTFTDETPFPGWAALLPVVGTVLVIAARSPRGWWTVGGVSTWRPVASVGKWSYSIYLWHWPIIVLAPFALQRELGDVDKAIIIVATVLLAALTSRFVETPARARRWGVRLRREFAFALIVPVMIAGIAAYQVAGISISNAEAAERAAAERVAAQAAAAEEAANAEPVVEPRACYGVTAVIEPELCIDPFTARAAIDTAFASTDIDPAWCLTELYEEWKTCTYGDPEGPSGTIALVGDSHAAAIAPAFDEFFAQAGWRVEAYTRFACSAVHALPDDVAHWDEGFREGCARWGARVQQEMRDRDDIDVVVYHVFDSRVFKKGDAALELAQRDTMRGVWTSIEETGKQVILLRDIPGTADTDIPTCLSQLTLPAEAPCSQPEDVAVLDDPIVAATGEGVPLVDISDLFCSSGRCMSYIGGLVVYADSNHISDSYARSLAPQMGERILAALD